MSLPDRIAAVTVDEVGTRRADTAERANRTVGWFEPLPSASTLRSQVSKAQG